MRRKHAVYIILAAMILTGCTKEDTDLKPLSSADGSIQEVKGFGGYYEKPTELQTEKHTEPPQTERKTEKVTEQVTEKITERQTEKPAEPETKAPYEEDYDFSEFRVLQAAFEKYGGFGAVPYEKTIEQDSVSHTRTETVTAEDGTIKITLYADSKSGKTNGKIDAVMTGPERLDDAEQMLLSLDTGIDKNNLSMFEDGTFSGTKGAPHIGLYDASFSDDGNSVSFSLSKAARAEGDVPGWESFSTDLSAMVKTGKTSGTVTDGADLFSEILQGIDMEQVFMSSASISKWSRTTNESGNITNENYVFTSAYSSSDGSYTVEIRNEGNTDTDGIVFTCERKDCSQDETVMNFADRIYRAFSEKTLDLSADLSARAWTNGECDVTKTGTGFSVRIHLQKGGVEKNENKY